MIEVFDYSDKQIPLKKIIETWELSFNKKFNSKYFNWRFKNNPNEKRIYIKYIMNNETLAAYYAVSPMLMRKKSVSGKGLIKVALSNMTMTHPDYRGKGYFQLLASKLYTQLKQENYTCVYTYPVREVSCHIFRKYLNFKDIALLKTMRLSKENSILMPTENYSFEQGKVNDEIINRTQSLEFTDKILLLLRDKENLKWRLLYNPVNTYYYLKVSRDNFIKVILFYKYYDDSIDIMDYCYSTSDYSSESDINAGLAFLFTLSGSTISGINIWTDMDSKEYDFLKNLGFVPTSVNTYFGIIPLNDDKSLLCKKNWHYRYFDSDVF